MMDSYIKPIHTFQKTDVLFLERSK